MSTRTIIERWLASAGFPADLPRTLDKDGFWSMPYGNITLGLGVPEERPTFVLYAPLMTTAGAQADQLADFYHQLLVLQLEGELPPGICFGMDRDDSLVHLVGSFSTDGMDAVIFERLVQSAAAVADDMQGRLRELFGEILASKVSGSSSGLEKTYAGTGAEPVLDDKALIHSQMMRSLRF